MKVDILVLNFNGKDLLKKFLPSVCAAAERSSHDCAVYVVDNVSTDGSAAFIKEEFPDVTLIRSPKNRVLFSYNDVVNRLDSDIVIFLNNDIKVKDDFVDPLVGHFSDAAVFFAAPCVLNMDGTFNGGRSYFRFKWGIVKSEVDFGACKEPGQTHMISCGAFRRDMFVKLGGFDEMYSPGIWEDADLCYAGLKKGYKGVYEPLSVIWHDESTTFKRVYGTRRKNVLAHRNMFLFLLKNLHDKRLFVEFLLCLPARLLHSAMFGRAELAEGFFRAVPKITEATSLRRRTISEPFLLNDVDIIR
jgi:GT2 family glycosyltransferase